MTSGWRPSGRTQKMKTIVLLSGGLDSAVCLAIAAQSRRPDQILALSFRYIMSCNLGRSVKLLEESSIRSWTWI